MYVARIVTHQRMLDHDFMSCVLSGLHWLPVDKKIKYKVLLYTYKTYHGSTPGYICELVVPFAPRRVRRSAELVRASANLWKSMMFCYSMLIKKY